MRKKNFIFIRSHFGSSHFGSRHFGSRIIPHQSGLLESANLATSHIVPWSKRARKHLSYTVCSLCSVGWFWDDQLRNASKICWTCGAELQKTANLVHQLKSVLGRMASATDVPCKAQVEALLAQVSSESGKGVPIETRVGQASQRILTSCWCPSQC